MPRAMKRDQWDALIEKGVLKKVDNRGATDWEMVYPEDANDENYTSKMYSPSLQLLRYRTFSEFYGNGIVD